MGPQVSRKKSKWDIYVRIGRERERERERLRVKERESEKQDLAILFRGS